MNLNNPVFNKILKVKERLVLGAGAKKKLFERLKRKALKEDRKNIRLSPLEFELLIEALNRAEEYEYALQKIEDASDQVVHHEAIVQKIKIEFARNGRTEQTARKVANIVKAPRKGPPWEFIIKDLKMLRFFSKTKQTFKYGGKKHKSFPISQKEIAEILYKNYKEDMQSESAMIKGLRRKGVTNLPSHSPSGQ